jgi:hypothetical protein
MSVIDEPEVEMRVKQSDITQSSHRMTDLWIAGLLGLNSRKTIDTGF